MSVRLHIELLHWDGALVRALALVERRGFRLCGVRTDDRTLVLDVIQRSDGRSVRNLADQLLKLEDVQSVERVGNAD